MHGLNDTALESNKYMKINFDGGDLSSDAGLLLIKEFVCKLGFDKILKSEFKTNDSAMFRIHYQRSCINGNSRQAGPWLHSQHYPAFLTVWMIPHFASFMTSCGRSGRLSMPQLQKWYIQQDIRYSNFAAAVHIKVNSMKHWKTSEIYSRSWNSNSNEP